MPLRKTSVTVLGWLLVVVGIAALFLPGPGLLLLLAGLIVLSQEYEWAERRVEPVKDKAFEVAKQGVSTYPKIAMSMLAATAVLAFGVVWWVNPTIPTYGPWGPFGPIPEFTLGPHLPLGGWALGSSVILSGLIAWGLLIYSIKRFRPEAVAERREAKQSKQSRNNADAPTP